jgi:acetyl esterase
MAIDPQLVPILDLVGGELPVVGRAPTDVRAMMSGGAPRSDEGLGAVEDITAAGLVARVYRPEGSASAAPGLVYFHGGGWVIGGIASHDAMCAALAAGSGVTVISVDYRLAPEHPFPAAAEDAHAATVWVADHATELGLDPARIAVGGDSAGGNLAAVASLMARDAGAPPLAFQLLIYPNTDLTMSSRSITENGDLRYMLSQDSLAWFARHYLGDSDPTDWRASPLLADSHAGLPPALVVTADLDPLLDEGEAYAAKLEEAGVPTQVERGRNMCHGFYGFPVDETKRVHGVITAALQSALG